MTSHRKDMHMKLALATYQAREKRQPDSPFADACFVHHAIPHLNQADIDLSTTCFGRTFPYPFYINAMTGGSSWAEEVNRNLAIVARECQLPMASGSVSAALKEPRYEKSYEIIRATHPEGFLFANLGMDKSWAEAEKAINLLAADALQIHLNTPQELIMPEGDRNFQQAYPHLAEIAKKCPLPLVVKEVGFGMSQETIDELLTLPIAAIDVSGRGGTNFAELENIRREKRELNELTTWGQSTLISLLEAQTYLNQTTILASGGVTTALEIVKCLALGARLVGLSGFFLKHILREGVDKTIARVEGLKEELRTIYLLLDAKTTHDLTATDLVILNETAAWCQARQLPYQKLACRRRQKKLTTKTKAPHPEN